VFPAELSLRSEILFSERATGADLVSTLAKRQPAFVLDGTLHGLCRFFGVDYQPELRVMLSPTGTAICFGRIRGTEVVVHIAALDSGREAIKRQRAGNSIGRQAVGPLAPEILSADERRIVCRRLPGQNMAGARNRAALWEISETALQRSILAALDPLKSIHAKGRATPEGPDAELLAALPAFVAHHPQATKLRLGLEFMKGWDRHRLPSITVHGDYTLRNLLFSGGRVSGIVDWDRSRHNGCPGVDAVHLAFASYAFWSGRHSSEFYAAFLAGNWRFPWLAQYCRTVQDAFGLQSDDLERVVMLSWLSSLYFRYYSAPTHWIDNMITPVYEAANQRRCL
jgi:hypothetical protein